MGLKETGTSRAYIGSVLPPRMDMMAFVVSCEVRSFGMTMVSDAVIVSCLHCLEENKNKKNYRLWIGFVAAGLDGPIADARLVMLAMNVRFDSIGFLLFFHISSLRARHHNSRFIMGMLECQCTRLDIRRICITAACLSQ